MLAVDEQSFNRERFWSPHAVKPLNFNYEFVPRFEGQNVWSLTDGLFVSERKRLRDEATQSDELMKLIYSQKEKKNGPARKQRSKYKQFPTLIEDFKQKSALKSNPEVSSSKVLSSLNLLNQEDSAILLKQAYRLIKRGSHSENLQAQSESIFRPDRKKHNNSPRTSKKRESPRLSRTKPKQQTGQSVKLSQEETERLLKSLDFKVRTRKKPKQRERSRTETLRGLKLKKKVVKMSSMTPGAKAGYAERGSQSKLQKSRQSLSSESATGSTGRSRKSGVANSVLQELAGPLPRVRWGSQEEKRPRRKAPEKTGVTVMKANKMSSALKKAAGKKNNEAQEGSRESSLGDTATQRVKTTKVRMIPKLTINNQLLKSTVKGDTNVKDDKKPPGKVATKRNIVKSGKKSAFWTPEKIALLDQITTDQQMKAVLMSAGDTYLRSQRFLGIKTKVKVPSKISNNASQGGAKKESDTRQNNKVITKLNVTVLNKPKLGATNKPADVASKNPSETSADRDVATTVKDVANVFDGNDSVAKKDNTPEPLKKSPTKAKVPTPLKLVKTKSPKSPTRDQATLAKGIKNPNVPTRLKRPPKSSATTKIKEKLTQLTEDPNKAQEKRMTEIRKENLDHLKKILDKSMTSSNEDAKTK